MQSSPSGLDWAGVLQCVRLCGLASAGKNSSRGLHPGAGAGWAWGSGGVCGGCVRVTGRDGCALGRGAPCSGCVRIAGCGGWCGVFGGWIRGGRVRLFGRLGRALSRGPGLHAMVGVCGKRGGKGGGPDCAGLCVVLVYVSACSGAPVWSVVGRAVWRRSLLSSAAAARTSQMSVRSWCTSWSVVGRGYASSGLRPTRRRILWMACYPQVRECCGLGGGVLPRGWACLDLCVGGGDGLDPGHGPCGWPAVLDLLGQAEHGQSQLVARAPGRDLGQGAGRG